MVDVPPAVHRPHHLTARWSTGAPPFFARSPRPSAARTRPAAQPHMLSARAIHIYIPSPSPCTILAALDAPRTRICVLIAARLKPSHNPPPAKMPRAAPPWRQTMTFGSMVGGSPSSRPCLGRQPAVRTGVLPAGRARTGGCQPAVRHICIFWSASHPCSAGLLVERSPGRPCTTGGRQPAVPKKSIKRVRNGLELRILA